MKPSDLVRHGAVLLIIGLIVALLVTQLIGQPFIVFVTSGSMEPTLQPNDGYLAVPSFLAGDVEEGDVILFDAQQLGGGELTTHRVVGETEEGYITQGDANQFPDQKGAEPPVSERQIKSVAVQIDGNLVVIPGLGATITSVTGFTEWLKTQLFAPLGMESVSISTFSTGILIFGLAFYVYSVTGAGGDRRSRSRSDRSLLQNPLVIIAVLTLVVIVPVNFTMLLPSGVYQIQIVSSEDPTANQRVLGVGESGNVTYFMQNSGHLPVVVFIQPASEGVETPGGYTYVPRRTTINRTVTMHAPNRTGRYLRFVREYRYLVVLPPSLIATLHRIHPVFALLGINVTVAIIVISVSVVTVGTDRIRYRNRRRELTIGQEFRRWFPSFLFGRTESPPAARGTGGVTRQPLDRPPEEPSAGTSRGREREAGAGSSPAQPAEPSPEPGSSGRTEQGRDRDAETDPGQDLEAGRDGLTDAQLLDVDETLQSSPRAVGIEADRWSPELVGRHLENRYGVALSHDECIRLLVRSGFDEDTDK